MKTVEQLYTARNLAELHALGLIPVQRDECGVTKWIMEKPQGDAKKIADMVSSVFLWIFGQDDGTFSALLSEIERKYALACRATFEGQEWLVNRHENRR